MRIYLLSIVCCGLALHPILVNTETAEDDGSLNLLMALFKQYSSKLENTMTLIKANKFQETNIELGGVKDALAGIVTVFKEKSRLQQLPFFGQLSSQLSQLSAITDTLNIELDTGDNKVVDGVVDRLKSAFSLVSQVKDKVQERLSNTAGR